MHLVQVKNEIPKIQTELEKILIWRVMRGGIR